MDRQTRCVLSWDIVSKRTQKNMQACLDKALGAKRYYSDAFPIYGKLYYGAPFELLKNKSETYSVEAVNADMRHYMKRLARKSRCFSRQVQALKKNMKLFVHCYNRRQVMKRNFPKYSFHLIDFLCPVV